MERFGGNMMSLHAEPAREGDSVGGGADEGTTPEESNLAFQTHVMKVRCVYDGLCCYG